MSWLDDITPDAGDPTTGMILGLLGGLGKAAAPQFIAGGKEGSMGVTGQSKGNALLQLFGDLSGGIQGGMKGAQEYRAADTANQSSGLDLQNKQMLNPVMMNARMNALQGINGSNPQNPTGLPQQPGSLSGGMTPYQQNAQAMINSAQRHFGITGDDKPLTDAWKSAFENDPSLKAEQTKQTTLNSTAETPNGRVMGYQMPGAMGAPGGAGSPGLFGSFAPAISSAAMKSVMGDRTTGGQGPGNQQAPEPTDPTQNPYSNIPAMQGLPGGQQIPQVPPVPQGALSGQQVPPPPTMPVSQGAQLPPVGQTSNVPAFNPFNAVSTEAAKKSASENAENVAEAAKTYNVMNANFDNMMQRVKDMTKANEDSSFSPMNSDEGHGMVTMYHDIRNDPTSEANAILQQRAAQGVLPELGPALSQAGIKGNKFLEGLANQANNIDLSKGKVGRQTQIDGLMKAYLQNMKSSHDQISGLGGNASPLPPTAIAQAVKYGVMTRAEAEKYLRENHGMK